MTTFTRVQSVKPREGFTVDVHFTNGSQREINLEPYLHGPIFEPIRNDLVEFRSMHIEGGAIEWSNCKCENSQIPNLHDRCKLGERLPLIQQAGAVLLRLPRLSC